MGFPGGSDGKESACNVGDLGSIPGLGRPPGGDHGNSLSVFLPREAGVAAATNDVTGLIAKAIAEHAEDQKQK